MNLFEILGMRPKAPKQEPFISNWNNNDPDSNAPMRRSPLPAQARDGSVRLKDEVEDTSMSLTRSISLSAEQHQVIQSVLQGKSVFFSGAAGTGKSYVLRILHEVLAAADRLDTIAFTAPTGVAACNINGLTIHAWAGIGTGADPLEQICGQVMGNRDARKRWRSADILVIDEISMLSASMLETLSKVGSRVRTDSRPFGGLQLVLCGDFFQLPPIGIDKKEKYCFESPVWRELLPDDSQLIVLSKIYRQKDSTFLDILNDMRYGKISSECLQLLHQRCCRPPDSEVAYTKLFSLKKDAEDVNATSLAALRGESVMFDAVDTGAENYLRQLRQGTRYVEHLELKVGAQVMLLKNLSTERGFVNGARGVVIGFEPSDGRSVIFPYLPLVEFTLRRGEDVNVEQRVILDDATDIRLGNRVLATRQQLPLTLAYALSIHKSQGMTLPYLEVSMRRIFEYGQAYVALSRAVNLDGLRLGGLIERHRVKAHPRVLEFYATLNKRHSSVSTESAPVATSLVELLKILEIVPSSESEIAPATSSVGVWVEKRQVDSDTRKRSAPVASASKKSVPSFYSPTLAISTEEEKKAEAAAKRTRTDIPAPASFSTHAKFSSMYYDDFFEDKGYTIRADLTPASDPPTNGARTSLMPPTYSTDINPAIICNSKEVLSDTKPAANDISEETRLKIERNRQLAKEKLEQARERRRIEMEQALLQVEQMNF